MRYKFANGGFVTGVSTSTNQPIIGKGFDTLEITDDYHDYWLEENGTFSEYGAPPADGDIEVDVKLINPSTHTIRKSYNKNNNENKKLRLEFVTKRRRNPGGTHYFDGYAGKNVQPITNLYPGGTFHYYFYPKIYMAKKNQTVNPFECNTWNGSIQTFRKNNYEWFYQCRLFYDSCHNLNTKKKLVVKDHSINYKIR